MQTRIFQISLPFTFTFLINNFSNENRTHRLQKLLFIKNIKWVLAMERPQSAKGFVKDLSLNISFPVLFLVSKKTNLMTNHEILTSVLLFCFFNHKSSFSSSLFHSSFFFLIWSVKVISCHSRPIQ
jgi:hypothetical protein